jgi:hypothetical protein
LILRGFDYWARELFQIHGLEPVKELPNSEQYLALMHPDDREFMASLMQRMLLDDSGFDVTRVCIEQVGWTVTVRVFRVTFSFGRSISSAQVIES